MKKGLTEMVFILDRSGSMSGLEDDTIGGFNSLIEKQKKQEGEAYVSTVLFNNEQEILYDRVPLSQIEPMTESQYTAVGGTALLDALGGAIHHIGNVHKYAREEDVPENTIFIITTDGFENASQHYTITKIKSMIKRQQERYGWKFVFLGANIDAISTAQSYGIPKYMAAKYNSDHAGMQKAYYAMDSMISCCLSFDEDSEEKLRNREWAKELDEDVKENNKGENKDKK